MSHPEIDAVLRGELRWCVVEGDNADYREAFPKSAAIVGDPPYGIGYQHSGTGGPVSNAKQYAFRRNSAAIVGDDTPFDSAPFTDFDAVLLWGADHFRATLPSGGTMLAWDKSLGIGPADTFADAEFAWTNKKVKRNVARVLWKGVCGVKDGEDGGKRHHPTQKPIALMRWCLNTLALSPDSVVIDPYCGSGTTGVAAIQLGHRFIGIEREPQYCAIARRRIADAAAQGSLF